MIPILYKADETEFLSNGLGRLDECVSCIVTEERNGIYECVFEYPITGRHFNDIQEGRIISATHDDKHDRQAFDIYARSAPLEGVVTFYAHHISYRLGNVILKPFSASSTAHAFAQFADKAYNDCPFTFWTDKETAGPFRVRVPVSIKEALGGSEGSILDVYGKADYEWDNWTVRLYQHRGRDTDVEIRYGKNMTNLTQDVDVSESYTAVAPYWYDGDTDTLVTVDGGIVLADNAIWKAEPITDENDRPITNEIDIPIEGYTLDVRPVPMDLSDEWENPPTQQQLRDKALEKMEDNQSWLPDENITVEFTQLWQTPEYASVAPLQRVSLCDRVNVIHSRLGLRAVNVRVIKTVYNVLLDRYDSMELGQPKVSFAQAVMESTEEAILKVTPSKTAMEAAIDNATKLISGGLGGHVVIGTNADGQPNEILILDTDDINTAVHVLRINEGGIGFSSTGYNGPYRSAWTLDGSFVADFITSGSMSANIITAGILKDKKGKFYLNLDTGDVSIKLDPGETGAVTPADLARVESNAQDYADAAEQNAKDYVDDALLDYPSNEQVEGAIEANNEGLRTEFSGTFSPKGETTTQVQHWYYKSTSPKNLFGGAWVTAQPEWEQGFYIWESLRYIRADNSYYPQNLADNAVCITGNTGAKGDNGTDALNLYITADSSTSIPNSETRDVLLTGCVGRGDSIDVDPSGTIYFYAWFKTTDDDDEEYFVSGKRLTITVNDDFCEDTASLRFALVSMDFTYITDETGNYITDENNNPIEAA